MNHRLFADLVINLFCLAETNKALRLSSRQLPCSKDLQANKVKLLKLLRNSDSAKLAAFDGSHVRLWNLVTTTPSDSDVQGLVELAVKSQITSLLKGMPRHNIAHPAPTSADFEEHGPTGLSTEALEACKKLRLAGITSGEQVDPHSLTAPATQHVLPVSASGSKSRREKEHAGKTAANLAPNVRPRTLDPSGLASSSSVPATVAQTPQHAQPKVCAAASSRVAGGGTEQAGFGSGASAALVTTNRNQNASSIASGSSRRVQRNKRGRKRGNRTDPN